MGDFTKQCFVCGKAAGAENFSINEQLNLPVCNLCQGSEQEKEMVKKLTEGLAEGFICGCI